MKTLKAKLGLTLFLVILTMGANAQKNEGKCVEKGNFIIDAYYGYPFVLGKVLKNINQGSATDRVVNTNHIGGKFEYIIGNKFGLGLDFTYAKVTNHMSELNYYNADSTELFSIKGGYKESVTKTRFLFRMNIHFATTEKIDAYVTFGSGFKNLKYKNDFPSDYPKLKGTLNPIPFAFRTGIGMRYFFNKNIGINAEAGIGGPIVQAGLSVKF